MSRKYTYERRSDTELKRLRSLSASTWIIELVDPREFITEILELRRQVKYWESLTHARYGGRLVD